MEKLFSTCPRYYQGLKVLCWCCIESSLHGGSWPCLKDGRSELLRMHVCWVSEGTTVCKQFYKLDLIEMTVASRFLSFKHTPPTSHEVNVIVFLFLIMHPRRSCNGL